MTFDEWMREVDRSLVRLCGMESADLPDCPYADWFEDEERPQDAAQLAIDAVED